MQKSPLPAFWLPPPAYKPIVTFYLEAESQKRKLQ
jgi:hypothetical protein